MFNDRFRPLTRLDRIQDMSGPRPTCATATRDGSLCGSSAIYLGAGVFGPNCYVHSTRAERDQYRQHQERIAAQVDEERYSYAEQMCEIGHEVIGDWMQQRQRGRSWFKGGQAVGGEVEESPTTD